MKRSDKIGMKFNSLLVIKDLGQRLSYGRMRRFWECLCDCGNSVEVCGDHIPKSCGCKNHLGTHSLTHGQNGTRDHNIWCNMRQRCCNPSNKSYPNYGGRGIKVCESWKTSYESFIADMGKSPSDKHTLDRIDVNGNYEPSNCRWATWEEQQNNRSNNIKFEYNGELKTIRELAKIFGFTYYRLYKLLRIQGKTVRDISNFLNL